MIRHHRLLELYLAEALGMPWDRVHEEAEVLEHAISPELSELIAREARQPDPRPARRPDPDRRRRDRASGHAPARPSSSRASTGVFVRVSDSDPEMLRYLSERGIAPGDRFEVLERQPFDGPLIDALRRPASTRSAVGSRG